MKRLHPEVARLKAELIRVKAERDAYRSLVLEAMRKLPHLAPMRIDELNPRHWSPIADMKTPVGW